MIRRPRRSVPAALTALAILVLCALVATMAIQLIGGRPPVVSYAAIAAALHRSQWRDLVVAIAGGAVALAGLVLLLAALIPGRATVLPLDGADPQAGVSRRSLVLTLRGAAAAVEGVARVTLAVRGNKVPKVRVRARADRVDDTGVAEAIRAAVDARIDQLSPANRPLVRVRVRPARRSER